MAVKVTRTIPIVFDIAPDPVGSGFVESLSQPGANATGFMMFEYNLCGKWLALLLPHFDGNGKEVGINIDPLLRAALLHARRRRRGRGGPKNLGKEAVVFHAEGFFGQHSPTKPSTDPKNPFHEFAERFYEVVAKTEPGGLDRQMRRVLAPKRSGR